jgi:hypothetical protein
MLQDQFPLMFPVELVANDFACLMNSGIDLPVTQKVAHVQVLSSFTDKKSGVCGQGLL